MSLKPSIPKGTRDFDAAQLARRNYVLRILEKNFQAFGFEPIETPSLENLKTLTGKYGEEGDRLIFKILNSGDFMKKAGSELQRSSEMLPLISEKALRYDLTVPFARYVVMHQNELVFPFKRYQMQKVWRADRPQKGRYREFFQCDADSIGSDSLWQEVAFVQLYDRVFYDLGLKGTRILINNRKILSGIAEVLEIGELLIPFTVALDKLNKIGRAAVETEMQNAGIATAAIQKMDVLFELKGIHTNKLEQMKGFLAASEIGTEGVKEMQFIFDAIKELPLKSCSLNLDFTLARGLNYYTGAIFEVSPPKTATGTGSIGGGGRYEDLTGIFGLKNLSGVGISFGLDRMVLAMEDLKLFPEYLLEKKGVLFLNMGSKEAVSSLKVIQKLRDHNLNAELYPDFIKMQKQMKFANRKNFMVVAIIGETEMQNKEVLFKNMETGEQTRFKQYEVDEMLASLKPILS